MQSHCKNNFRLFELQHSATQTTKNGLFSPIHFCSACNPTSMKCSSFIFIDVRIVSSVLIIAWNTWPHVHKIRRKCKVIASSSTWLPRKKICVQLASLHTLFLSVNGCTLWLSHLSWNNRFLLVYFTIARSYTQLKLTYFLETATLMITPLSISNYMVHHVRKVRWIYNASPYVTVTSANCWRHYAREHNKHYIWILNMLNHCQKYCMYNVLHLLLSN